MTIGLSRNGQTTLYRAYNHLVELGKSMAGLLLASNMGHFVLSISGHIYFWVGYQPCHCYAKGFISLVAA